MAELELKEVNIFPSLPGKKNPEKKSRLLTLPLVHFPAPTLLCSRKYQHPNGNRLNQELIKAPSTGSGWAWGLRHWLWAENLILRESRGLLPGEPADCSYVCLTC